MGLLDAFSREDRIEIPVPEFVAMIKAAARNEVENDILRHALLRGIPRQHVFAMLDNKEIENIAEEEAC